MQVRKFNPTPTKMDESIVYLQKPTLLAANSPRKCRRCRLDSSQVWINMAKTNPVKEHGQQEKEIVGDCELEVQEQVEVWETTSSRAKRSRCKYSPENAGVLEKSLVFPPPLLSRDDKGSLKPNSTECNSSASISKDPDGVVGRKKLKKLIEVLKSDNNQKNFNGKDENRDGTNTKSRNLHQSPFTSSCVDDDKQGVMEIVVMDVQLSVNANPRGEKAPFVSLRSEAYGIAVIGYPLDVGEIRDGSETLLLSKESVAPCKSFGDRGTRLDQLVWTTSKRTPVCYVTSSPAPSRQAGRNVKDAMLPLLRKEKSIKNSKQASNKTCVPVEVIFSKILAAVD